MMRNEIWSEIGAFLNGLRCGNVKRESYVQIPELEEAEKQKKKAQETFRAKLESMKSEQRECVENYMEILMHFAFVSEEQAYCQGYVDCIQLLAGLGVLKEVPNIQELVKKINK
jgi:hypothetical protein